MKKRCIEELFQNPKTAGIHRRHSFRAFYLEGEISRKLNEKINLKPVESSQVEKMGIRGHIPGLAAFIVQL